MPLSQTQQLFFKLLRAPTGVAEGLAHAGIDANELEQVIRSDHSASATERMSIYANMYFFRILEILQKTFPLLLHYSGEDRFHNWVTEYLWLRPSLHPSVGRVGEALGEFLRQKLAADADAWLADLALLEWARSEVFEEADEPTLTQPTLQAMPPEQFALLPLAPISASRMVALEFGVDHLWYDNRTESPPRSVDRPVRNPQRYWVWRSDSHILHRPMDELESAFAVSYFGPGQATTFGQLCDWLLGRMEEPAVVQKAFTLLAQWIHDGLIIEPKT